MAHVTRYSAVNLIADAKVDPARRSRMPGEGMMDRAVRAIEARSVPVVRAGTNDAACQPPGQPDLLGWPR